MKLEFVSDVTDGGKYPLADPDKLLRLYDFSTEEALQLYRKLEEDLIAKDRALAVHELPFVSSINCALTLHPASGNAGIDEARDGKSFHCFLTRESYETMASLIGHFATLDHALSGYHWLYDPGDQNVPLLFSDDGSW
ncbi:MAG: hypothetical protein EOO16_18385 [Chitinophagaceae bacterium]|nr:MAG: hypothetical protein EOO16_18385 [Chitinophagaceae bacterium]